MPTDIVVSIAVAQPLRVKLRAPQFWIVFPVALGLISIWFGVAFPEYRDLVDQNVGLQSVAGP